MASQDPPARRQGVRLHPFGAIVGSALVVLAAAAARSYDLPRHARTYYDDAFIHLFYDLGLIGPKTQRPTTFGLQILASFVIGALALLGPRIVTRTPLLRGPALVVGFPGVVICVSTSRRPTADPTVVGVVIQALPVVGPIGAVLGAAGVLAVGGIQTKPRKPRNGGKRKAVQAKSS